MDQYLKLIKQISKENADVSEKIKDAKEKKKDLEFQEQELSRLSAKLSNEANIIGNIIRTINNFKSDTKSCILRTFLDSLPRNIIFLALYATIIFGVVTVSELTVISAALRTLPILAILIAPELIHDIKNIASNYKSRKKYVEEYSLPELKREVMKINKRNQSINSEREKVLDALDDFNELIEKWENLFQTNNTYISVIKAYREKAIEKIVTRDAHIEKELDEEFQTNKYANEILTLKRKKNNQEG